MLATTIIRGYDLFWIDFSRNDSCDRSICFPCPVAKRLSRHGADFIRSQRWCFVDLCECVHESRSYWGMHQRNSALVLHYLTPHCIPSAHFHELYAGFRNITCSFLASESRQDALSWHRGKTGKSSCFSCSATSQWSLPPKGRKHYKTDILKWWQVD